MAIINSTLDSGASFSCQLSCTKKLALIYASKSIMADDQDAALSSDCDIDQFNAEQKSIFATRSSLVI